MSATDCAETPPASASVRAKSDEVNITSRKESTKRIRGSSKKSKVKWMISYLDALFL